METTAANPEISNKALWTGRVLSGLVILFLLMDGAMKMIPLKVVTDTAAQIDIPATVAFARLLGVLTLVSTVLYAVPRTSVLGAILLTAYMGGAIETHLRIGNPLFSHTLFGVYLGLMVWGGLYLRDPRIRALIPFRG
ncbi:MAG: DoxX family protein [Rhizobiaceae bacterium]